MKAKRKITNLAQYDRLLAQVHVFAMSITEEGTCRKEHILMANNVLTHLFDGESDKQTLAISYQYNS